MTKHSSTFCQQAASGYTPSYNCSILLDGMQSTSTQLDLQSQMQRCWRRLIQSLAPQLRVMPHDLKIAEHWDTSDAILPRSEWKNDNGKF